MEKKELDLCDALEDWREAKAVSERGAAYMMDYGAGFILPTTTLDRIVDCAHQLKLRTTDDLRRETCWSGAALYGEEVLAIVNRLIPQPSNLPLLIQTPLPSPWPVSRPHSQSRVQSTSHPQTPPTSASGVKKNKCSACGLPGHNSMLFPLSINPSFLTDPRTQPCMFVPPQSLGKGKRQDQT